MLVVAVVDSQLYQITPVRTVNKTRAEKRRAILSVSRSCRSLCVRPLPLSILILTLTYIVQGHCHNIFEIIGCLSETYETPSPSSSSTSLPSSSALCLPSNVSSASSPSTTPLPIPAPPLRLSARQPQPKQVAPPHGPRVHGPPPHHVPRHLGPVGERARRRALAVDLLGRHAFEFLAGGAGAGRAHPSSTAIMETLRWATVVCALLVFAYFGFADEAIKNYRGAFQSVAKCMGYTSAGSGSGMGSTGCVRFSLSFPSQRSIQIPLSSSRGASATLPVFIRKDTTQKRDSFDSFCDTGLSASYGGISTLEYEDKEKGLTLGDGDTHALTLENVSEMLPDYKESDYSSSSYSASSSASSDTESVGGEEEGEIEVSSLHRASMHIPIPTPPEPAHTHTRPASADVPMPVSVVDVADIV
ncbi:hypothetical protein B0H13DRAFT_2581362 [Mycena leptocephala]|nr:hypothetical protein B0H13DRAFT_2581362 [Mycena leptocephala]